MARQRIKIVLEQEAVGNGQVFLLLSGDGLNQRLNAKGNYLTRLVASHESNEQIIENVYWAALSRPPSDEESNAALRLLNESESRLEGLQDIAWALLNSKEFIFRH